MTPSGFRVASWLKRRESVMEKWRHQLEALCFREVYWKGREHHRNVCERETTDADALWVHCQETAQLAGVRHVLATKWRSIT